MQRITGILFPAIVTAIAVVCGYLWLRQEVTSRIYRDKLERLALDYAALADHYNDAVRRAAITELEATDDALAVIIRTADGQIRRIPTPFNPRREIFVDYVVGDGRIWIRRVFDQATSPEQALVVDPALEFIDWQQPGMSYGKIIYRSLQPGLWSIQVSGGGALTLEPVDASRVDALQAAPAIRSFEEIQLTLDAEARAIGPGDLWRFSTGWLRRPAP